MIPSVIPVVRAPVVVICMYHFCYCCVMLQVPIVRNGGVEAIVAAARAHPRSVDVSHYACLALSCLADHAPNQVMIDGWMYFCVQVMH